MVEINKPSRVVHKHDIEENWLKAVNFIPKQAEIVVYDRDNNHDYERFKIGDGVTNVNELPFSSESVQSDYTENDETSKAFIKNRPFGDFGEDIYSASSKIDYTDFNSNFNSIYGGSFPILWAGASDAFGNNFTQHSDNILGLNVNLEVINTSSGTISILSGAIGLASSDSGVEYYYIGEVYIKGEASNNFYEDVINFAADASPRLSGIAWAKNPNVTDSTVCGGASTIYYRVSSGAVYGLGNLYINIPITRLKGKYLPIPFKTIKPAELVINDSTDYYVLDIGGPQSQINTNIVISDDLFEGVVKYLTIRNMDSGNTISSTGGNLYPVSINGVSISDLANYTTNGIVNLQIIVNYIVDGDPNNTYKASWILLGHSLPSAEDYTF